MVSSLSAQVLAWNALPAPRGSRHPLWRITTRDSVDFTWPSPDDGAIPYREHLLPLNEYLITYESQDDHVELERNEHTRRGYIQGVTIEAYARAIVDAFRGSHDFLAMAAPSDEPMATLVSDRDLLERERRGRAIPLTIAFREEDTTLTRSWPFESTRPYVAYDRYADKALTEREHVAEAVRWNKYMWRVEIIVVPWDTPRMFEQACRIATDACRAVVVH